MTATPLLTLARVPGPLVTGYLVTVGSFVLGLGVMTGCTSTTDQCGATHTLLTVGWLVQGLLFAGSVALWLPWVKRHVSGESVVSLALLVPIVSALAFVAVSWAAPLSY